MKHLKPLVNNYELWTAFKEHLETEKANAVSQLTRCSDPNELLRYQGDLRRIDKMLSLKTEVNRSEHRKSD